MIPDLGSLAGLSGPDLAFCVAAVFVAGLVRGFSGFALSALVMASLVFLLPPITLLPIAWFLELSASLLMARGGWRDADRRVSLSLVITSVIGFPLGLWLTNSISPDTSRLGVLLIILASAVLLLFRPRLTALATAPGLVGTGLVAGIVSGLSSTGGMIVALYVLASDAPARVIRGSLVTFLFLTSFASFFYFWAWGMMTVDAARAGAFLVIPAMLGVVVGQRAFRPAWEPYYRPFCLGLVTLLATWGLLRRVIIPWMSAL